MKVVPYQKPSDKVLQAKADSFDAQLRENGGTPPATAKEVADREPTGKHRK